MIESSISKDFSVSAADFPDYSHGALFRCAKCGEILYFNLSKRPIDRSKLFKSVGIHWVDKHFDDLIKREDR